MASLNRVTLIGNLGRTPELCLSKKGKPYVRLSVATRHRVAADGEEEGKEVTDWHSVFVWGELAERCAHTLNKGSGVYVEGSLSYWTTGEIDKQYKNAIHAYSVHLVSSPTRENLDNPEPARNHNAVAHPA